jgi:hypothetical protein
MSNKSHENDPTSPENQPDNNIDNKNAIGLDEGSMKLIVIVLGVMLFFGFIGVVGTIVYRVMNLPQEDNIELGLQSTGVGFEVIETHKSVMFGNVEVEKPNGTKMKSFQVNQGNIYVHFENSVGFETIKIIRLRDGMVVGSVNFVSPK